MMLGLLKTLFSILLLPVSLGLLFAVPFGGYWIVQTYPTMMAVIAGGTAGAALAFGLGPLAVFAAAAAVGALVAAGATRESRRGLDVVTGVAAGLVLGRIAGTGPVAYGAMAALAVVAAGVVWRFRRPGLVVATSIVGSAFPTYAATVLYAPDPTAVSPYVTAVPVFSLGLIGAFAQPFLIEYSDSVPPMLPQRLRSLFGFTESAAVDDAVCPDCNRDVDPSGDVCPHCSASLVGVAGPSDPATAPGETGGAASTRGTAVPDDAVAVDIACQHCGERPVEEVAKGYRVTGLLLAYRITTVRSLGCHRCNRRELWRLAGKNLLIGWWSITSILINPFATLYNVGRSLIHRGPTPALAEALNDAGLDYEFMADADDFDLDRHTEEELHLRSLIRLGCATMLTDGQATRAEATAMRDAAVTMYPEYPTAEIEERIRKSADSVTNAIQVARGLSELLTPAGKEQALQFVAAVAAADDEVDPEEMELISRIADAMEMTDADVERALTGEAV
jgi:uncharacterized tellurite resistance protein B-like protein